MSDKDDPIEYWEPSEEQEREARQRYLDGDIEMERGGGEWYEPKKRRPPEKASNQFNKGNNTGCILGIILILFAFMAIIVSSNTQLF